MVNIWDRTRKSLALFVGNFKGDYQIRRLITFTYYAGISSSLMHDIPTTTAQNILKD